MSEPRREYRVEFTIQRREPGDADFSEIGFGSSGAWSSVDHAGYMAETAITRREWETEPGMPKPETVDV